MSRRAKIILIQAAVVAGLVVYFKVALPRIEKARAEGRAAAREVAMTNYFESVTMEMPGETAKPNTAAGTGNARRLRRVPDVEEVQQALGAPNQSMPDFAGAQHLTWIGTEHKLIASFNKGQLYALTISDLSGEHGERVFESSAIWQKF